MIRKTALALLLAAAGINAHAALSAGDIAFTSFNADEDGLSFVSFTGIAANTSIYFSDNEWTGAAFNTGESYNVWNSGAASIAAGTVIRLSAYDKTTPGASVGSLSRVTVSGSANWGIANSTETVYAYLGTSATAPTTFLTAITNGSFAVDGSLTGTGLTEGVNAIRLNTLANSATPDYAEYTGLRSGAASYDAYKPLINNLANWNVDTANGNYTATIPNTTAFSVTAVPEPKNYAMFVAGLGLMGLIARRQSSR
ncbi:PEP-CTERM sorting domain-containing protein [Ferribacterium limneticum]|uniref:PEP-CTERM sorting domain-containing protein n=1 Tax=Ferribacterium limneticum TaxID=76259 RepID=UPI001CF8A3D9|nr:PEP-CTERM sorting domain-containing protein [Ferribacterium limneticum]UCV21364.1 PEP-CTERM sorting domain-containing protein [Ferribacterium limneticum]